MPGTKGHRTKETFASDNIMSDGMLPPISADELVNEQIRYIARSQGILKLEPESGAQVTPPEG